MDNFQPQDRIKRMVNAIKSEAQEKAKQIKDSALQQFSVEKIKQINQQKEKLNEEYRKNLDQEFIKRRIQKSAKINGARLRKMEIRYDKILLLKKEIRTTISEKIRKDNNLYKDLMKKLIMQTLIKLLEKDIEIKVLRRDLDVVKSIKTECEKEFVELFKKECNVQDFTCNINVNSTSFIDDDIQKKDIIGGLIATTFEQKIVCSNTIDDRLDLCFQEFLPDIRKGLFPSLLSEQTQSQSQPKQGHSKH